MIRISKLRIKRPSRYRNRAEFNLTTKRLINALLSAQSAAILDGLGLNK